MEENYKEKEFIFDNSKIKDNQFIHICEDYKDFYVKSNDIKHTNFMYKNKIIDYCKLYGGYIGDIEYYRLLWKANSVLDLFSLGNYLVYCMNHKELGVLSFYSGNFLSNGFFTTATIIPLYHDPKSRK